MQDVSYAESLRLKCGVGVTDADEGIATSASLAVHQRHESSSVVLRPHASRSHRQQILTRHGRKYEHCWFPELVCTFLIIVESSIIDFPFIDWRSQKFPTGGALICSIPSYPPLLSCPTKLALRSNK